jgi:protein-tyrosine phosphatase
MKISHEPSKVLEYNYIDDGIYIGTNLCCIVHFDDKLKNTEEIRADISLEAEHLDNPEGVDCFLWLPVKDKHAPTQDQLQLGVSALEKIVKLGQKVYVHCMNGHGRAPTLVAAYFIKKGKTVEEAIEFVKSKRPIVHLEDVQVQALEEFSKK